MAPVIATVHLGLIKKLIFEVGGGASVLVRRIAAHLIQVNAQVRAGRLVAANGAYLFAARPTHLG